MWQPEFRCVRALLCAAGLLLAVIVATALAKPPADPYAVQDAIWGGGIAAMNELPSGCDGDATTAQGGCCGVFHCAPQSTALSDSIAMLDHDDGALPRCLFDIANPNSCIAGATFRPPRRGT